MINVSDIIYVVNRVQLSASEYNNNGFIRTFLYKDKKKAVERLKSLRAEDISELERLDIDYDVYSDTNEKFQVAWDSDLEMVFITMNEKTIE